MIVSGIGVFQLQAKADAIAEPILAEVVAPAAAGEGPTGEDQLGEETILPRPSEDGRETAGETPMREGHMVAASSRPTAGEECGSWLVIL